MKKNFYLFLVCICLSVTIKAQNMLLSDSAVISLITCDPANMAYALYGHTAIRVNDPQQGIDYAFNYGVFDFDSPNFIYRFSKGETDYILGVSRFSHFLDEYKNRKSGVTEQVLNLSSSEKQILWKALIDNSLPENRTYRYNFLYDNCATRPRVLIEKAVNGAIHYPEVLTETSFRELIHHCNRNHRWLTFGIDLVLGAPLDDPITQMPQLFLPDKLMDVFADAAILQPNRTSKNLISETRILAPYFPVDEEPTDSSPLFICWMLFGVILLFSAWEIYRKKYYKVFDFCLFFIYGIVGCIVAFLSFVSYHPCVFPNYNLIWAHPLHLVLAFSLLFIPKSKFVCNYMIVNGVLLFFLLLSWPFISQTLNLAFMPLILALCLRSMLFPTKKLGSRR